MRFDLTTLGDLFCESFLYVSGLKVGILKSLRACFPKNVGSIGLSVYVYVYACE